MLSHIIFVINTILLAAITIFLSYLIVKQISFKTIIKDGINKSTKKIEEKLLQNVVDKYTSNISKKKTLREKIEVNLIQRSNINKKLKYIGINVYVLFFINIVIFVILLRPIFLTIKYAPSAVIISFIISLTPYVILDIMGRYNSQKVRRKLAEFISILNRWCTVKEDIFYAFEKSLESGIDEPLKTYIEEFVIQVKSGLDPLQALDILQIKVDNEQFTDFIINVKQNIKSRGDTRKLLSNLEQQFYKMEFEFNRRKISTLTDRIVIYTVMVLVLIIGYYMLKFYPEARFFYLQTEAGKNYLMLFCILYVVGIYFALKITKFKY